jgi:hypothetical protein
MFKKINKALCTTFFVPSPAQDFIPGVLSPHSVNQIAVFVMSLVIQDDVGPFEKDRPPIFYLVGVYLIVIGKVREFLFPKDEI